MKIPKAQLGVAQILLIIFLLVGIVIGVILVQRQTNILSKAKEWGCQQPPVCLSYDPPCQVSKPFRGWWCPENTPRNCDPVKSVTPYNSCGKDMYKNVSYVCGDGTRGQIGSGTWGWGVWGRTSSCKSLADFKQEVAQRCLNHTACQPRETSVPVPSVVPNPLPTPIPGTFQTCAENDCLNGFNLCFNKTTEKYSCIDPKLFREMSTDVSCTPCPRIELPPPSASPDSGS